MGNQNQNQNSNSSQNSDGNGNNNSENKNENHDAPPSNSDNSNENSIHEGSENNNLNSINPPSPKNNNENQNKINEETNNGEGNTTNENPENSGALLSNENNSDCPVPADLNTYQKDFSFNGLMSKIKETAKKAGLKAIYMALLLYYALESPTCTTMDKAIIYGALGYFISPLDIVPDILPLIGLTDDIAVLAWAYSRIKHNISDMTREKAKTKLKIWFGDFDEKEIDDL